ncbi:hypothetical protein INR49_004172 [Caranx melampygus]|nr:hypothetical protein INR49_004172 [Caranx melampygus]
MTAVSLLEELSPNPPMKATDKPDTSISKVEEPQMNVSCSGHARAGQELCYLCMQRAQRNVPVCLREQQQAEEEAQEKVLLLQDKQREQQSMEQEQVTNSTMKYQRVKLNEQREHAKQVATFNLQMSEKKEKTTCPLFPVGDKKLTETPQCQTDDCWFNRYETAVSDAEDRERAHKLFQENFTTAAQRKKTELHRRQAQLEREREMLKFNKADLILDSVHHFEKKRDVSKSLEDEWSRGVKLKHQREEEERRLLRSAGQLLVDKLTQYKRCHQCKRRTSNCGESNIWKDSHHLSGSQFMT